VRDSATTEEYLAAVTNGPREPLNGTIHRAPYDPVWASSILLLAGRIRAALAERVLLLEHVGSTSVPGLAAKPVIDRVLAVSDSADELAYVPLLQNQGFALRLRERSTVRNSLFVAVISPARMTSFYASRILERQSFESCSSGLTSPSSWLG
jgi:GrpB-like predicted nucleotidyltransferase (UPF0157 family)